MHKNLKRGLSQGPLDADARTWPGMAELLLFRVIGSIWPTSDLNHAVVSPTRVLMGAYLALGRVRSLRDIASGLFLCTLFLQFEELSKRLVPEAVNFLSNVALHLAPHGYKDVTSLPGSFPSPDFMSDSCRALSLNVTKSRNLTVHKPDFVTVLSQRDYDEQTKVDLLGLSFHLLGRYADMYKSLEGFLELFEPPSVILQKIHMKKLPENLRVSRTPIFFLVSNEPQVHAQALIGTINKLLKFSREGRQPLYLQSHKPIPIPSYIPKFEVNSSSYLRNRDPDHERNEASKLRRQVKQEKKGAIRELRKDARFLAAVQQKKQAQKDLEYNTRMKRVLGSIESERAEEKAMEREKSNMKKRAGRK
jgi:nucleolar protein 14